VGSGFGRGSFITRTVIAAAEGQFGFQRYTMKMFVLGNTQSSALIIGEDKKTSERQN